ncbi:MAG: sulfatase-like hydrolase/transferase [Myxococcota bacterium]
MLGSAALAGPPEAAPICADDADDGDDDVGSDSGDTGDSDSDDGTATRPPNVLLVTLDDVGRDKILLYEEPAADEIRIPTPTFDSLAATGVRFTSAWSTATCSPTRATLLTGQYPTRNGVTTAIDPGSAEGLDPTLPDLLPRRLHQAGYATAAIGKWHVTSWAPGDEHGPVDTGFDRFSGHLGSFLTDAMADSGEYYVTAPLRCDALACTYASPWITDLDAAAYEADGVTLVPDVAAQYDSTDEIDEAVAWVEDQSPYAPWFLWLSMQAPHSPYVLPPRALLDDASPSLVAEIEAKTGVPYVEGQRFSSLDGNRRKPDTYEARAVYAAMLTAADTELGRLLASIDLDDTVVIVLGDNGTSDEVVDEDRAGTPNAVDRAKATIYEGGIGVPFVVHAPGLVGPGRTSDALVHTADLYATVLALAGVDPSAASVVVDGESFVPALCSDAPGVGRSYAFSEHRNGAGTQTADAVRDARYKLIHQTLRQRSRFELYDLWLDPYEQADLLQSPLSAEAQAAYDALLVERDRVLASF